MAILERKIIHSMSTLCSHVPYPQFVLPRHKHPEFEIMVFNQGSGKQFVGEGVADYSQGDLALIGSNVPHLHLCNTKLNDSPETEISGGDTLQFLPEIFPLNMENLPDYRDICELLYKSQYGIRFYDKELYFKIKQMIREINGLEFTARLIHLFRILEKLSLCKKTKLLSHTAYNSSNIIDEVNDPINKVYTYLFNHFKDKITLKDIADYVNLNPSALCRSFKQKTDKSIFQCLAEIRIEHACRLLSYSNLTVSQIAYESGYNNIPYFIKQFYTITNRNPKEYREQINT
ncbi:AraC family transcriptional regulator [Dysgonomonas sp. 216]|uniref:AraC family transcriptional regulator n=1 Tax=Dysgonomonas sp. 216 TaxID=2302934 RepID=UPI0013CFDE1D|nr:AraC family transcriptional regulator [Dysgonomonas sp. 216]NDW19591.1 AraC family transcriptional regulator [Dysgonomonas sp. 216]